MRGPSSQDCEKSFARTGIPSENLKARKAASRTGPLQLVQIQGLQPSAQNFAGPVPEDMAVTA
jgi:hypothetical protein